MTKSELANKAGISISFLSDLTNGKANPSLKIMEAIADALDTPLTVLLEFTDLDRDTLSALSGGKNLHSVPKGYERLSSVILNCYQAALVKKWDELARKNYLKVKQ